MSQTGIGSTRGFIAALLLIGVMLVGIGYIITAYNHPGGYTTTIVNGSTVTNVSGSVPPPTTIYAGSISFTANEYWAIDQSGFQLSSSVVNVYHADGKTLAGALTVGGTAGAGTATTVTETPADNGKMVICYLETKSSSGFLDPAKTVAANGPYLSSYYTTSDVNGDGYYDDCFPLNLSSLTIQAGQTAPTITINMYAWKPSTSNLAITNISSPTGMNTANTYYATGYLSDTDSSTYGNQGYEARIQVVRLWASQSNTANTTASSLETLIAAGSVSLKTVSFAGVGALSGTAYGFSYGSSVYGLPSQTLPPFDSTNTRWVLYIANNPAVNSFANGVGGDQSQVAWGLPVIWEKGASSTWFSYSIGLQTTNAAMTSGSVYYITWEIVFTNSAATTTTKTLKITLTG